MTEPELITALVAASADARAVLAVLTAYAAADTDVTVTLSSGASFTLPGVQKQRNGFAADFAAQKLGFAQDFGGVVAQTVARDGAGNLVSVTSTLASGWQLVQTYSRDARSRIAGVTQVVKDGAGATLATVTRTLARDAAGRYLSMS